MPDSSKKARVKKLNDVANNNASTINETAKNDENDSATLSVDD